MPSRNRIACAVFAAGMVLAAAVAGQTTVTPPAVAPAPTATPTPAVSDTVGAPIRAEFRAAYALAAAGLPPNGEGGGEDSAGLRAYPLYPYLLAQRLQRRLKPKAAVEGLDEDIAAFFAVNGDALAGRDLRRAWLNNLAERGEWARFAAFVDEAVFDAGLRCHSLSARIALGRTEGLTAAVAEAYAAGQKSPACDAPFAWAREAGALSAARIEQRARALLKAGDAREARTLATQLPPPQAAAIQQWAALIDNPQAALDALIADPAKPVEAEALLDGWTRLARRNADAAQARWPGLVEARGLRGAAASPYAAALGLALSWNRDPAAARYFSAVAPADVDEKVAEWSARNALWRGDWPAVAQQIAAMPPALRGTQRWRYWSARAADQRKEPAARESYTALVQEDGWYPALAAARLGGKYAPHPQAIPMDAAAQAQLAALPALVRAKELYRADLRNLATLEWVQGLDALDAATRAQAVVLAAGWGWTDQAVGTATKLSIFNDYARLYPQPYDAAVKSGAEVSGLPPALIYGVIRQESLYRADAVSKADARGLMQLLPETARRTAQRIGRPLPSNEALFEPMTNVTIAAAHLRELVDRFGGLWPPAIAGYNAGPNAAARWLPADAIDADIWIENISYNETRSYVQRVLWHSLVFAWQRSGEAQSPATWLKPVGVVPSAETATDEPQ